MCQQPTAVLLARYSPKPMRSAAAAEQDKKANSCDTQLKALRLRAAERGYLVDESLIFREDAVSGGNTNASRAVMRTAVDAACKRGRVLMIRDIERLGRSLETFAMVCRLQRAKAGFEKIDEGVIDLNNPHQLGWIGMKIINGIVYRLTTARRTRDSHCRKQVEGRRMSKILPYGKQAHPTDSSLVVDCPEEQAIINSILDMRASGLGQRRIVNELQEGGVMFRGKPTWHHTTIRKILHRAAASARP